MPISPTRTRQTRLRRDRFKGIDYKSIFPLKDTKFSINTKFTTILASGPNGTPAWDWMKDNIPRKDNTILAMNYAVTFSDQFENEYIKPDGWVVTDSKAVTQIVKPDTKPWFPAALDKFVARGGESLFNLRLIETIYRQLGHPGPFWMFKSKRIMTDKTGYVPHNDVIRPGGSVSCSAMQIWAHFATHPEKVLLICGADMSGDKYAKGQNDLKKHGEVWNSVRCFSNVIKWYHDRGYKIYIISESKLFDTGLVEFYPGSLLNTYNLH